MSFNPSMKSILLASLIVTLALFTGFAIFVAWAYSPPTVLLYVALSFVGLGCGYILYKGFKQKQVSFAFAKVMIAMLVVGSIFMYSSIYNLSNRVAALEKPELHEVNWQYASGVHNAYQNYTAVSGDVFNSGSYAANVTILFNVYNKDNLQYMFTRELPVGMIGRKSYISFSTQIIYWLQYATDGITIRHTFLID